MNSRVVLEKRHNFIYYDYESKDFFPEFSYEYTAKLNSDKPIVLYENGDLLPRIDTKLVLNKEIIGAFHSRYYELLIFLAIIDNIANNMDHRLLNNRLTPVFELLSYIYNGGSIKDINTLRTLLVDSKNMYRDAYIKYMETGVNDVGNSIPIPFIMMDILIPEIQEVLGLRKHFCFLLDINDPSVSDCIAINDYIASKCNGYLYMKVLLDKDSEWKCYHSSSGKLVVCGSDYTEVCFRKHKSRRRCIHE